jgi:hypothetical protein
MHLLKSSINTLVYVHSRSPLKTLHKLFHHRSVPRTHELSSEMDMMGKHVTYCLGEKNIAEDHIMYKNLPC